MLVPAVPDAAQESWARVPKSSPPGSATRPPAETEGRATSGLVAYLDGEPVGWCAVAPRAPPEAAPRLRVPWLGRTEDKADTTVWAVTCFVTRVGYRRRGIGRALARAAAGFAR